MYKKYKLLYPFNLYLIKFPPKAYTNVHKHNNKDCYFISLSNGLLEKRYLKNKITSNNLIPYKLNFINDKIGSHQIYNISNKNKYSINYYK